MTPISEKVCINALLCTHPKTAGPIKIPTSNCPMTAGIPIRRLKWPANEVVINTKHNVPKNSTIKFLSRFASNAYKKRVCLRLTNSTPNKYFNYYLTMPFFFCHVISNLDILKLNSDGRNFE